jgi:hypothetical protein
MTFFLLDALSIGPHGWMEEPNLGEAGIEVLINKKQNYMEDTK